MYVCLCKGITDSKVRELAHGGAMHHDDLASRLGINEEGCCGRCVQDIQSFIDRASSYKNGIEI